MGVHVARAGASAKPQSTPLSAASPAGLPKPTLVTNGIATAIASTTLCRPRLVSQSGKLHYLRQITVVEAEAVERWTKMLMEMDQVVYGMSRSPRGASTELFSGGGHSDSTEREKRILAQFRAAQEAILTSGRSALLALNRLCMDEASSGVLPEARKGLAQLVVHFRLDSTTRP
jgi:hypothetical protein